ncbi:Arc family DNA-binding protein [Salmonella enterica]|nr:Arc family DNA-binding protein [Salmonella enterica]
MMPKRNPQLNIRLPQELKDRLGVLASINKRSVNAEAVAAIETAVITGGVPDLSNIFVTTTLKKMLSDRDVTEKQEAHFHISEENIGIPMEIGQTQLKLSRDSNLIDIIQKTVAEVLRQQQKKQS